MKKIITFLCNAVLVIPFVCFGQIPTMEEFFEKYPNTLYQDIYINGQTIKQGKNICDVRHELIKPYLDSYKRRFKVLDLGAAQGYFSFRTAYEYPHSYCVMVETNDSRYKVHGDMLGDLCLLNADLKNICYLNKSFNLADLWQMNKREHFDVIYCLVVLHMMFDTLEEKMKAIDLLLSLGDYVIIETANDVDIPLTEYVEELSKKVECDYLGEVNRFYDSESASTGKIYCFKGRSKPVLPFKNKTYEKFNGVYSPVGYRGFSLPNIWE